MHIIAAVNVGDSLQQAFDSFFGFLPNLLGFLIILVVGPAAFPRLLAAHGVLPLSRRTIGNRRGTSRAGYP